MPFEAVDIYELAEDIVYHLQPSAEKKQISLVLEEGACGGARNPAGSL